MKRVALGIAVILVLAASAPVAAGSVPPDVAAWAHGDPVVGQGAVWTIRSAIDVAPHPQSGQWYLKFPWFLRPPGIPTITGRRLDGGGAASATVGVGLGANALVGGSGNTIALQPLSGQAQTGLSVAAGIAGLELRPGR